MGESVLSERKAESTAKIHKNKKFTKIRKTNRDIDGKNSFMKFGLDPITIKGLKFGGKFFGP